VQSPPAIKRFRGPSAVLFLLSGHAAQKKSSYEVLIYRDDQWMLEHLLDDEDQAKSAADRLMLQPTTAGVRVTKKFNAMTAAASPSWCLRS
jgi:hypothetical protein